MRINCVLVLSLCVVVAGYFFGCADKNAESLPEADTDVTEEPYDSGFDTSTMPLEDRQYLEDFSEALKAFDSMSMDDFRAQYGPDKAYSDALGYEPLDAEYMDTIQNAYPLSDDQLAVLSANGFVIAEDRGFNSFFEAYEQNYFMDLPNYVTADAILDALHLSFDRILLDIEEALLIDKLSQSLDAMDAALPGLVAANDGQSLENELADVAFWVCGARSLLAGERVACQLQTDGTVQLYLDAIEAGGIQDMTLFGASVSIDFSQFTVRGHYTKSEALGRYFQSMMWVQRMRMDVTRYQRHAVAAALLTKLFYDSGADASLGYIDTVLKALVGRSDSLNAEGMRTVLETSGHTAADLKNMETYKTFVADLIASGVGQQLINSQILMSNPTEEDGFTPIPPAFHLMGQRFVVDSYVFTNVVEDRVPERLLPSPLDAMFVLGNRATLPLLENEIEQYAYQANLAALDYLVGSYPQDFWESSSYNLWLSALRDLNADTTGAAYPPVMKTQAWERRILNAQLGSWAHLKHDTVLYAKQSYTNVVCEYPDGWVDPYPDFYRRVGRLAAEMQSAFEPLGIFEFSGEMVCDPPESDVCGPEPFRGNVLKYTLKQIADTMDMLADIADMELTGERLNDAQIEFIKSMVNDWGECGGPSRDGWYTDIIYRFSDENAWVFDPTVADVHTDPNTGQILHVGVGKPMLMVTTVKTDCQLTAYAGAAFGYHEFASENMTRWTDEQFKTELESGFSANPAWTDTIIE